MENFKILEQKENPLFKRKEVEVSVDSEITPSHTEVEKLISEKFSTEIENIKIKKIHGKFGSKNFLISAKIYESQEEKDRTEQKSKKLKKAQDKPAQ